MSLQDNIGREVDFLCVRFIQNCWLRLRLEHKVRIFCEDGRFIRNKKYVDLTHLVLVDVS